MENFLQRRESSLSNLVGSETDKQRYYQEFKDLFENPQMLEHEAQKTSEEIKTINQILEIIPSFITKYGTQSYVPVTAEHLHYFELSTTDPKVRRQYEEGEMGSHDASKQHVIVLKHPGEGAEIVDIMTIIHEIMHVNSFHSTYAGEEASSPRRAGLNISSGATEEKMYDPSIRYFNELSEAVTEELARRFLTENFSNIDQVKEFSEAHSIKVGDIFTYISSLKGGLLDSYSAEREVMWELCGIISSKDTTNFPDPNDVFNLLAKSYFTGRLLPIARLIEQTLGSGTFKQLAHSLGEREDF